jgi:hypothetical protein
VYLDEEDEQLRLFLMRQACHGVCEQVVLGDLAAFFVGDVARDDFILLVGCRTWEREGWAWERELLYECWIEGHVSAG